MRNRPPHFKPSIIALAIATMYGCGGGGGSPAASNNAAPVANAGTTQSVTVGTVVTLNGSASTDADGDTLTDSWTLTTRPASSTATLAGATTVTPTFTADQPGTYVATLVVNDGKVNSPEATVTITAAVGNATPVANAGTAQNVTTGTVVTLNGSGSSDANGDPLTYSWVLTNKPASSTAVLTGATTAAPSFTPDLAGSYVATLVVNDGTVDSTATTVTITAAVGNSAPVANAGTAQSVVTGALVTLDGSASSDANGDPLTYSWVLTSKPASSTAAIIGATTATPTFTPDLAGSYVATLVVNDGTVDSTATTVSISAAVPDTTAPTTTVAPTVSGTTDTTTTLSVTIDENGTGYYLVQASALAAPTVGEVQAGTAFAMSANVAATPNISGLTASTAYAVYFVAKDAANNVQAAVQSVAVSTGVDVTPPAAPTGLTLDGGAAISRGSSTVHLDGLTTPPDADLAAWFVSESTTAPAAGDVNWSSTKPTIYSYASTAVETKTVCVYVKDTLGNVQPTGACDTIDTATPAYVTQGGLTWMPVSFYANFATANTYCTTTTINGQTGWRLPSQAELSALYASGAMNGQGWILTYQYASMFTWSSTPTSWVGDHYGISLDQGEVTWNGDGGSEYVTCVR